MSFSTTQKLERYQETRQRLLALLAGEQDTIALMATIACELHEAFDYYHWTGFYRVVSPKRLKIGPYQGSHGCLDISFDRGICGAAASSGKTQIVADVRTRPEHIACSSTTISEIVVPLFKGNDLIAVLDVDSNFEASFDEIDQTELEKILKEIFN